MSKCSTEISISDGKARGALGLLSRPASSAIIYLAVVLIVHVMFTTGIACWWRWPTSFIGCQVLVRGRGLGVDVRHVRDLSGRPDRRADGSGVAAQPDDAHHRGLSAAPVTGGNPLTRAFAAAVSMLTLAVIWVVFHRTEYTFAENI
jgi:hypothetical protein